MRLKSKTFLVIGGALCAFGAIFCAIILAIGQFDFMKVISVEKYEDKVYTLPAGALTALNLDAQNQRVVFQPAAGSDIVIRYREFASDTYTFEQQGASLNVTYRCDQKWYQSLVQGMFGGIARASQSITVEVPPQYAGLLNARTTNASLTADSLPKLTECRLATTNGTLRVSDITADTFILSTTNAGVHLDRLQGAALFVTSTNGSIHMADLAMTGELTARTTNASLQADRVEAAAGQFNTTNGSLALRNGSFSGTVSAGTTTPLSKPTRWKPRKRISPPRAAASAWRIPALPRACRCAPPTPASGWTSSPPRISGCPAPTVPSKAPSPAASRIIPS